MDEPVPVVCPACAARWRVLDHLAAAGADGALHRPLGPRAQLALVDVFGAASAYRASDAGGERYAAAVQALHASVYALVETVEREVLAAMAGAAMASAAIAGEYAPARELASGGGGQ